eukprot:6947457-Prymnesium_polylepis.1
MEDIEWAKKISSENRGGGVIVVGAMHVVHLHSRLSIPNASYFSIYRNYEQKNDVVRDFTPRVAFPLLTKW